jgi:hypothetical protein
MPMIDLQSRFGRFGRTYSSRLSWSREFRTKWDWLIFWREMKKSEDALRLHYIHGRFIMAINDSFRKCSKAHIRPRCQNPSDWSLSWSFIVIIRKWLFTESSSQSCLFETGEAGPGLGLHRLETLPQHLRKETRVLSLWQTINLFLCHCPGTSWRYPFGCPSHSDRSSWNCHWHHDKALGHATGKIPCDGRPFHALLMAKWEWELCYQCGLF